MQESNPKKTVFIVVGRLGKSLTISKVVPFLAHPLVDKTFIFREEKGFYIKDGEYVRLDSFLSTFGQGYLKKVVRFLAEPIQLILYARRHKPYLINGVFTLPKGLNALIASKLSGTKSVVSVIGGAVEITTRMPGGWFWKRLNLWMLTHCDAVTTKGSNVTAWLIEQGISSEKIFNLNGSIDAKQFSPAADIERDIDVLFVGDFSKLKGPDRVLEVIENLVSEGKNINAVFLGEGSMFTEIKKQIEENKLGKYVLLEGYQNNTAPYFQRSKTIIMPSMSEGLPTAMLEAMSCGCVPVVSDVGNVTDAAKHGENAIVIDNWNDIEAFTSAVGRIISDDVFREQLSLQGIKTVEEKYTPEKQAQVVDQILQYLNKKN